MDMDLRIAVAAALILTILIALIEILHSAKANRIPICLPFVLYFLILAVGNVLATLAAVSIVQKVALNSEKTEVADSQPEALTNGAAQSPAPAGPLWFWYAAVGVFAFEAVLQRINVTVADQGVLTINDWVRKARDRAVAAVVELEVNARGKMVKELTDKLNLNKDLSDADLNTYVQQFLGPSKVHEIEDLAKQNDANPRLAKALALATVAYDEASKLV